MKAVEAVKEKFYCFLGIVHPTYYQSRGWGPWLGSPAHLVQLLEGSVDKLGSNHFCKTGALNLPKWKLDWNSSLRIKGNELYEM